MLIAVGNSGDADLAPLAEARLDAENPLVRGAAIWALRRLAPARADAQRLASLSRESDNSVRLEWTADL